MLSKEQLNKKLMGKLPDVSVTSDGKLDFVDADILKNEANPKYFNNLTLFLMGPLICLFILGFLGLLFLNVEWTVYTVGIGLIAYLVAFVLIMLNRQYVAFHASTVQAFSPVIAQWLKKEYNFSTTANKMEKMTSAMLRAEPYSYTAADNKRYIITREADDSSTWIVQNVNYVPQQHQYTPVAPNSTQQVS